MWSPFCIEYGMEDNIFDISFQQGGKNYTGWVNPSDKLSDSGRPISFHVVLNDISFGYLSYNNYKWSVNEDRLEDLVQIVGEQIEKYFTMENKKDNAQQGGITDKRDKNAGSGAFNQGAAQDPRLDDGVADGTPHPEKVSKEKENPKARKTDEELKK